MSTDFGQSSASPQDPARRVVELEEKLMFSQRAVEELNEVVLKLRGELDDVRREIRALRGQVDRAIELVADAAPPSEKPPHY